jgi:hypothetical protein
MPKQDVLLKDVDVPEGHEFTGEFRAPIEGEPHISDVARLGVATYNWNPMCKRLILRRIEPDAVKLARAVLNPKATDIDDLAQKIINDFEGKSK